MFEYTSSRRLFERAQQSIPGGVNSPVRAFKSVGGTPPFIKRAKGTYLFDEDDNQYLDFIASWGPMILGHAREEIIDAIKHSAEQSSSFGAPTLREIEMAECIREMNPGIDMVRMVNSGTEACMSAIRLARGYTGKNKFIKFEGCYHGHGDMFLVKAGSGLATFGIQHVPGVTTGSAQDTLTATYNDLDGFAQLVRQHQDEIAAIILEPVAGNMGCIPPQPGFLEGLRKICDEENIVLIFDEVMTGFRLATGGAQEVYGVQADLVTYGKVIGAGMPVGAFGGKKAIMEQVAPLGQVYQAGTLSGNPLAMAAGLSLLKLLKDRPEIYEELEAKSSYLETELHALLKEWGGPAVINRKGSMISLFFSEHTVQEFDTAAASDIERFNRFFHALLSRGVYLPPSGFETWFLNNAMTYGDLDQTLTAVRESLKTL